LLHQNRRFEFPVRKTLVDLDDAGTDAVGKADEARAQAGGCEQPELAAAAQAAERGAHVVGLLESQPLRVGHARALRNWLTA
jgi:hypothetical protein